VLAESDRRVPEHANNHMSDDSGKKSQAAYRKKRDTKHRGLLIGGYFPQKGSQNGLSKSKNMASHLFFSLSTAIILLCLTLLDRRDATMVKDKKLLFSLALLVVPIVLGAFPEMATTVPVTEADRALRREIIDSLKGRIQRYTLANGMTVIVIPAANTNVVSVGAFVRVGSTDEQPGQWGLAHILEHMVFKETKARREGDIERLAKKFASRYNAHTSHDHTHYYFTTDNKNWRVFADVVADATQNLQITPQVLNSELAVICQEIKLRGADLDDLSVGKFLPMNHPCAHSLIGYKEQVLSYSAADVMAFYEQHYTPDKTTFFVCGNVNPEEVLAYAQDVFAGFNRTSAMDVAKKSSVAPFFAGFSVMQKTVYHTEDYRVASCIWLVPGATSLESLTFSYIATALTLRLKNKFVDQLGYYFNIGAALTAFPETGLFSVTYVPRPDFYQVDFDALIAEEIASIAQNGLTDAEFAMMFHAQTMQLVACAEDPASLSTAFASTPQGSGDVVNDFFARQEALLQVRQDMVKKVAASYLRPFGMNKLLVLPLPALEREAWVALQVKTSLHESALLQARQRGESSFASESDRPPLPVRVDLDPISVGHYETFTLSSGMQVYWQADTTSPRRVCALVLKDIELFNLAYQAAGKEFAWQVAPRLLLQGTGVYSAKDLREAFLARGVSLVATSDMIKLSTLKNHFEEGLDLLIHLLNEATMPEAMLSRYKEEALQAIDLSKNSPSYCLHEYLTKTLYAQYPWRFSVDQAICNLQTVTRDDVVNVLSLLRDPTRVGLVMCGDFDRDEAFSIAERHFGAWQRQANVAVPPVEIPASSGEPVQEHLELPLEHSQVMFLRDSCRRGLEDAASLVLLNRYLEKVLFAVRERSGLFYACGAKIALGTKNLPGLMYLAVDTVPANVSVAISEMQNILKTLFEEGLSESEFREIKEERVHARGTYFNTADTVSEVFIRSLSSGYALDSDERFEKQVDAVTFDQLNTVVRHYFDPATWSCITIGRRAVP